ncbi:tetratricopeptide repeat protein [Pseudomonadota bacterium]
MKIFSLLVLLVLGNICFAQNVNNIDDIYGLKRVGDYQNAIDLNRNMLDSEPNNALLLNLMGELQFETGKLDAAEKQFRQVVALASTNSLTSKLNLAQVFHAKGEQQSAASLFQEIYSSYQSVNSPSSQDLYAIAHAAQYLGRSNPQLFKQAVQLFTEASQKDQSNLDARIALGELLLEKYNNEEALEEFAEVLKVDDKHPRALLGLARSQHFDYSSIAMLTVRRALEINPYFVSARVFLSRLYVELEQYAIAEKEANLALQVNPVSLEALSLLAVIYHLEGRRTDYQRIEKRILKLNPHYAELYTVLADLAAQNRFYSDAAKFSQRAISLDSRSWRGFGLLGMNQLRLGNIEDGRANLDRSFAGDPYNIWIKNTLELTEKLKDYAKVSKGRFLMVVDEKEKALLGEYIHQLAERAYKRLKSRYRYEPALPIRIELYPDHADFSVRSVGLAGVGLLGVCFGPVVAMDSPSARQRGQFNWGSTLWHELAHVFHLSMTDSRVPRWFSEGLAVYEERMAEKGWGGDVSPEFLIAYLEGRLLPVSELNNGFVRPSYPEQVNFSYYQASLVFEFIEQRWGFGVIRQALNAYKIEKNTYGVLARILKLDAKSLDAEFDSYFRNKFSIALKALEKDEVQTDMPVKTGDNKSEQTTVVPDKYIDQLETGKLLYEKGDLTNAELFLKRAQQLFPEYAGADSSYWILAELYMKQTKPRLAEKQLAKMTEINAEHYQAHIHLAMVRAELEDIAGAAKALERAIYIYPFDLELHQHLAGYYSRLGSWKGVSRERRAVLALDPVDKAEAYYQLAHAYSRSGQRKLARQEILFALEIAPNFYRAQELLLSLRKPVPKSGKQKQ